MKWMVRFLLFYSFIVHADAIERGQIYFFQYCASCHSLKYVKADFFKEHQSGIQPWMTQTTDGRWISALNDDDAQHWFGRVPPDLSLITEQHSKSYVIDYLMGFYDDVTHPLGRNNKHLPSVLMPDVLSSPCVTYLCLSKSLKNANMDRAQIANDIAEFLVYVATPQAEHHRWVGLGVMMLCLCSVILAWLLKKNY